MDPAEPGFEVSVGVAGDPQYVGGFTRPPEHARVRAVLPGDEPGKALGLPEPVGILTRRQCVVGSTQQIAEAMDKEGSVDRLGREVCGPCLVCTLNRVDVIQSGHHHDRGHSPTGEGSQLLAGLVAVDTRHDHIEQDDVGPDVSERGEGLATVDCLHHVEAGTLEGSIDQGAKAQVVVDHHDGRSLIEPLLTVAGTTGLLAQQITSIAHHEWTNSNSRASACRAMAW